MFDLAIFDLVLTDCNFLSDVVLLQFYLTVSQEVYHRDETSPCRKTVVTGVVQFPFSKIFNFLTKIEGLIGNILFMRILKSI